MRRTTTVRAPDGMFASEKRPSSPDDRPKGVPVMVI